MELMESEGYMPVQAANGKEALDKLTSAPMSDLPGLILLDLVMPVMNGIDFMKAQQRNANLAAIPVVVMSAEPATQLKQQNLTAAQYLKKPVPLEAIVDSVNRNYIDLRMD
jgi:two-component system, chemotaxis family, chemotaxis protein CheY